MNSFCPPEKQLKRFGLIMAGMLSFFTVVFFFKTWYIAMGLLGILSIFFAGMGIAKPRVYEKFIRNGCNLLKLLGISIPK